LSSFAEFESYDSANLSALLDCADLNNDYNYQFVSILGDISDALYGVYGSVLSDSLYEIQQMTNYQDQANELLRSVTNYLSIMSTNTAGSMTQADLLMLSNTIYLGCSNIFAQLEYGTSVTGDSNDYNEWFYKVGMMLQSLLSADYSGTSLNYAPFDVTPNPYLKHVTNQLERVIASRGVSNVLVQQSLMQSNLFQRQYDFLTNSFSSGDSDTNLQSRYVDDFQPSVFSFSNSLFDVMSSSSNYYNSFSNYSLDSFTNLDSAFPSNLSGKIDLSDSTTNFSFITSFFSSFWSPIISQSQTYSFYIGDTEIIWDWAEILPSPSSFRSALSFALWASAGVLAFLMIDHIKPA